LLPSPAIDSITFVAGPEQLQINVNTHDPSGETRYYKWDCVETYEYKTDYFSGYILEEDGDIIVRTADQFIDRCWQTDVLHDVLVRSTASLTEDRVANFTIRTIPRDNIRISVKYSLLVKQQRLTEKAFRYWRDVKQTTENLGSLFDPLPAQVIGNLQCVSNPEEPVIGFFTAGTVSEKRIFIDRNDLPRFYSRYEMTCLIDTVLNEELMFMTNPDGLLFPFYDGPAIIGWATTSTPCFDCRALAGGTTTQPDFWE